MQAVSPEIDGDSNDGKGFGRSAEGRGGYQRERGGTLKPMTMAVQAESHDPGYEGCEG